jgi:hypothetical protein
MIASKITQNSLTTQADEDSNQNQKYQITANDSVGTSGFIDQS